MGGANLQERNYYQSQSWPFITVDYLEFYNFGGGIAPHVPNGKGPPQDLFSVLQGDPWDLTPYTVSRRDPDTGERLYTEEIYLIETDRNEPFVRILDTIIMAALAPCFDGTVFTPNEIPKLVVVSRAEKYVLKLPLYTIFLLGKEEVDWNNLPLTETILTEWQSIVTILQEMVKFEHDFKKVLDECKWHLNILIARSRLTELIRHIKAEDENIQPWVLEYWEYFTDEEANSEEWIPRYLQNLDLHALIMRWRESPYMFYPKQINSPFYYDSYVESMVASWEQLESGQYAIPFLPYTDDLLTNFPEGNPLEIPDDCRLDAMEGIPIILRPIRGGQYKKSVYINDFTQFYLTQYNISLLLVEEQQGWALLRNPDTQKDILMKSITSAQSSGSICGFQMLLDLVMPTSPLTELYSLMLRQFIRQETASELRDAVIDAAEGTEDRMREILEQLAYLRNVQGLNVDCSFADLLTDFEVISGYDNSPAFWNGVTNMFQWDDDTVNYITAFTEEVFSQFKDQMQTASADHPIHPAELLMTTAFTASNMTPEDQDDYQDMIDDWEGEQSRRINAIDYSLWGLEEDPQENWEVQGEGNLRWRSHRLHLGMASEQDLDQRLETNSDHPSDNDEDSDQSLNNNDEDLDQSQNDNSEEKQE